MSKLERKKHKKKMRGSQEIRQGIDLAKVVAVGVVVLVIVLAVGNYSLTMMKNTGIGNATIYNQGMNMLNTLASGAGNLVSIVVLVLIIVALGVVIATVERW
jgi:ABC-type anion transport system duplicated permease subunit